MYDCSPKFELEQKGTKRGSKEKTTRLSAPQFSKQFIGEQKVIPKRSSNDSKRKVGSSTSIERALANRSRVYATRTSESLSRKEVEEPIEKREEQIILRVQDDFVVPSAILNPTAFGGFDVQTFDKKLM